MDRRKAVRFSFQVADLVAEDTLTRTAFLAGCLADV
jgi:hypothetical protein